MASLNKIAAVLAFVIGAMAVVAGGKTLLGIDPGYYVINWLVLYNYTVGIVSLAVTAVLIWTKSRLARPAAIATFGLHGLVMALLQTAYQAVVAPDSLRAMTIRLAVWLVILGLLWFQSRATRPVTAPGGASQPFRLT